MKIEKRPYELKARGHVWAKNSYDRKVDIFGFSAGEYHNGPICVKCGYGFCHHCEELPDHDCPKAKVKKKAKSRKKRK